ncbi:hypothetical protein BIW11_05124 [Tropilaelaps mercedesae]|uniref:Uncharacterized protein n=1 Tax=Tropilaelaps mercedesae TaxID=418985 RepID=A0A1V9Y3L9_9ACAR|nr:hypothetical protein BIW11_05124 [Tropilaelaps mercedesae]
MHGHQKGPQGDGTQRCQMREGARLRATPMFNRHIRLAYRPVPSFGTRQTSPQSSTTTSPLRASAGA